MPVEVTLYSRKGCCLCDDARAALLALNESVPLVIVEVEITSDPGLEKEMFDRIPVVKLGQLTLHAPLDSHILRQAVLQLARRSA
jgi:hypothetical protein